MDAFKKIAITDEEIEAQKKILTDLLRKLKSYQRQDTSLRPEDYILPCKDIKNLDACKLASNKDEVEKSNST